jgi:transposase
MAASTLSKSQTALGSFLRRLKARLGPAKAITAVAHKLAVTIYHMIREKVSYKEAGVNYYETLHKGRAIRNLHRFAERLGYSVAPKPDNPILQNNNGLQHVI